MTLCYQLFYGTQFALKEIVKQSNFNDITLTLAPAIAMSVLSYLALVICFACFVFASKMKMKLNGWLFISTILVITTLPFELYLILKFDKPFMDAAFWGAADANFYINLIIERFKVLGSFPIIEIFSFIAIAFLFLFRPFRKQA